MTMSFDTNSRKKLADEENKQQLVQSIESENQHLKSLLDEFYDQPHRTEGHYAEVNESILEAIDKLLAAGDWESSLFLRNAAKPLKQAREEILRLQQKMKAKEGANHRKIVLSDDMQLVYVSIYQSEGHNLANWEKQLRSVSKYLQGRPVYTTEEEAVRAIRAKLMPGSEAYIKAAIKKSAILSGMKPAKDRLEQPLLNLAEGAVQPENIIEFVHMGKRYSFMDDRLISL